MKGLAGLGKQGQENYCRQGGRGREGVRERESMHREGHGGKMWGGGRTSTIWNFTISALVLKQKRPDIFI